MRISEACKDEKSVGPNVSDKDQFSLGAKSPLPDQSRGSDYRENPPRDPRITRREVALRDSVQFTANLGKYTSGSMWKLRGIFDIEGPAINTAFPSKKLLTPGGNSEPFTKEESRPERRSNDDPRVDQGERKLVNPLTSEDSGRCSRCSWNYKTALIKHRLHVGGKRPGGRLSSI